MLLQHILPIVFAFQALHSACDTGSMTFERYYIISQNAQSGESYRLILSWVVKLFSYSLTLLSYNINNVPPP